MAKTHCALVWLDQANADFAAATVKDNDLRECHRRYFFQQAVEKAMKALGFASTDQTRHSDLSKVFKSHNPLEGLDKSAQREIREVYRTMQTRILSLQGSEPEIISKIIEEVPVRATNKVSYRYPFEDPSSMNGELVAPANYAEWEGEFGNEMRVRSAVSRLLKAVDQDIRKAIRTPNTN